MRTQEILSHLFKSQLKAWWKAADPISFEGISNLEGGFDAFYADLNLPPYDVGHSNPIKVTEKESKSLTGQLPMHRIWDAEECANDQELLFVLKLCRKKAREEYELVKGALKMAKMAWWSDYENAHMVSQYYSLTDIGMKRDLWI